jgi:Tfp pilus assembly protein PilO
MKEKINNFWSKAEYRLKILCGKPSPTKRLVFVLVICVVFAAANIYYVFSSIYGIGKNDGKKELIKLQHIEQIKLQQNDSINQLKQNLYEYEYK